MIGFHQFLTQDYNPVNKVDLGRGGFCGYFWGKQPHEMNLITIPELPMTMRIGLTLTLLTLRLVET